MKKYKLAIHTIFIPRENLFFLKEWLEYHILLGVEHFYLYDNTGSYGFEGSNSTTNKYGVDFKSYTNGLTDQEVGQVLDAVLGELTDYCTLVEWRPRDANGRIEYNMGAAIVDVIEKCNKDVEWLCCIDMDEYLYSKEDNDLNSLCSWLSKQGHSRCYIQQKKFSDRYLNLNKYVIDIYECIDGIDTRGWAPKLIINTDHFDSHGKQFIHDIPVKSGTTHYFEPDILRFNHYNVNQSQLEWMNTHFAPESPFKINAIDSGMQRYRNEIHARCKHFGTPVWRYEIVMLDSPV